MIPYAEKMGKPKIPAKRAPMPEGYDSTKTRKQQGSPALQGMGGVHAVIYFLFNLVIPINFCPKNSLSMLIFYLWRA
jgi:hypothetical protein